MDNVRLICFDLGRVLIRICDNWIHACKVARVPVTIAPLDDINKTALLQAVFDCEVGDIDQDGFCRRTAPLLGITPAQVQEMSNAYLLGIYPGVMELIDDLTATGFQTACLSNTNPNHWRIICDPGLPAFLPLDRFTYAFASHLIRHRKPETAIYEYVERVTGLKQGQIVFFDDVPENIDAARSRGWIAELILHDGNPIGQIRAHLARLRVFPKPTA